MSLCQLEPPCCSAYASKTILVPPSLSYGGVGLPFQSFRSLFGLAHGVRDACKTLMSRVVASHSRLSAIVLNVWLLFHLRFYLHSMLLLHRPLLLSLRFGLDWCLRTTWVLCRLCSRFLALSTCTSRTARRRQPSRQALSDNLLLQLLVCQTSCLVVLPFAHQRQAGNLASSIGIRLWLC